MSYIPLALLLIFGPLFLAVCLFVCVCVRTSDMMRCCSVVYTPGSVATGMSVVIEVEIWCTECGVINTEAAIETETEHFFIPINAVVLSSEQFGAWELEGGHIPCNVTPIHQPPTKMVRSKAPTVATLRKQLDAKRDALLMGKPTGSTGSSGGMPKMHDLQDPVSEPEVPSTEIDWFVDGTRHVIPHPTHILENPQIAQPPHPTHVCV